MVEGTVAPGFEPVREAFEALGDEAQVCAIVAGERVVDLWRAPFRPGSRACVYSVTKPFAAFALLLLVDRGQLGLDDRVVGHWPTFGKPEATVRHVLAHQAGVPQITMTQAPPEALFDHGQMAELLEREPPAWTPGTAHGEHALTYGHLVGELVRRTDGRTLGGLFAEEVAAPWRLDFTIGDATADIVDLVDGGTWQADMRAEPVWGPALGNPPGALDLDVVNGDEFRAAEIAAINGHGSARAIARLLAGREGGARPSSSSGASPS